jgi:hypothetical protein
MFNKRTFEALTFWPYSRLAYNRTNANHSSLFFLKVGDEEKKFFVSFTILTHAS